MTTVGSDDKGAGAKEADSKDAKKDTADAQKQKNDQLTKQIDAQKVIAEDSPYIALWNRTNVAIAQPSLHGLHINTTGNFESLKDVTSSRQTAIP